MRYIKVIFFAAVTWEILQAVIGVTVGVYIALRIMGVLK